MKKKTEKVKIVNNGNRIYGNTVSLKMNEKKKANATISVYTPYAIAPKSNIPQIKAPPGFPFIGSSFYPTNDKHFNQCLEHIKQCNDIYKIIDEIYGHIRSIKFTLDNEHNEYDAERRIKANSCNAVSGLDDLKTMIEIVERSYKEELRTILNAQAVEQQEKPKSLKIMYGDF